MRRRDRLAKIKRLALSGDGGVQAVEMLTALADDRLWEAALRDCGLRDGSPVLGPFFEGTRATEGARRLAWLHVVGGAPEGIPVDASLLAPERLRFEEWRLDRWPRRALPRFASVEALVFDRCWLARLPGFVLHMPRLRSLVVERARFVEPLPALDGLPLERLRVAHAWLEEFPAALPTSLRELSLVDNRLVRLPNALPAVALDLRANPLAPDARAAALAAGATL